jgi:hypothetical protein
MIHRKFTTPRRRLAERLRYPARRHCGHSAHNADGRLLLDMEHRGR